MPPVMRAHSPPLMLLRATVAALLFVHGVARVALGIVDDFGVFLTSQRIPFGPAVAWIVTIVELVGGVLLALGVGVRILCAWFAMVLVAGIGLVHARDGWFAVGAGRNGMEYSVLLIVCLIAIAWSEGLRRR
jgi:putative oxidoreductase